MSKILLIDVDSKIPNLALMKISAYHKSIGDTVGFNVEDPDKIYISCIFKKNKSKVDGLKLLYPNAEIDAGGSGYDLDKRLDPIIERMTPDYDLYPDCDSYLGFTTRGCVRNCYFCIVRKKEGFFKHWYNNVDEALENITGGDFSRFDKISFLDNNILADRQWFIALCERLSRHKIKVDFNQGLDIRLIDEDCARALRRLKPISSWKFAFDDTGYKDHVERGIRILNEAGIRVRHDVMFYVYVHNDNQFDDALYRCHFLKDHGATPYVMLNQETEHTRRMKELKRWCRPWVFWKIDLNEYTRCKV